MTTNNTQEELFHTVSQLNKLLELYGTILEAAQYGDSKQSERKPMLDLMQTGMEQFTLQLSTLFPKERSILDLHLTSALQTMISPSESLVSVASSWYMKPIQTIFSQLFQLLNSYQQLEQQVVDQIYLLLSSPNNCLSVETKAQLLFKTANICGQWAPELSFQCMMEAFCLYPTLTTQYEQQFSYLKKYSYKANNNEQLELTSCPVCGGIGHPYLNACSCFISTFNDSFLPAKFWMQCDHCSNLYTRYFPESFFQLGQTPVVLQPDFTRMTTKSVSQINIATWGTILNTISHYTTGKKLLEVGVGEGLLIAAALEMGYDVTAVELLESVAQETATLLQHPIVCGDFLHFESQEAFSIITMGDVLEHLRYPVDGIKKAHSLLKDGGILWLSTPNYQSGYARFYKAEDVMWREPYHVTYFSREGLLPFLEDAGFELLQYTISTRYVDSMELILRKK